MDANYPNNDCQFIKNILLQGNSRLKLIVYRRILCKKGKTTVSAELKELIDHGLIIKSENEYKIYNKTYRVQFNKNWVENKLVTEYIKQKISSYVVNDQDLSLLLLEAAFNNPRTFTRNKENQDSWVDNLLERYLIEVWHRRTDEELDLQQVEKEILAHLTNIEQKILKDGRKNQLIESYQKVLDGEDIQVSNDKQIYNILRNLNLIIQNNNQFIPHYVYKSVFDSNWCTEKLQLKQDPIPGLSIRQTFFKILLPALSLAAICFGIVYCSNREPESFAEENAREANKELNKGNDHKAQALSLKSKFELQAEINSNPAKNNILEYSTVSPIFVSGKIKNSIYVKSLIDKGIAPIRAVDFNYNGTKMAVGGEKGQLSIYEFSNTDTGQVSTTLIKPKPQDIKGATVSSLAFYPGTDQNQQFLVVAENNSVKIFRVYEDKLDLIDEYPGSEEGHTSEVYDIQFSKTGEYLFTIDRHKNLRLWSFDVNSGQLSPSTFLTREVDVKSAAFSTKSNTIVIAKSRNLSLYDLTSGEASKTEELNDIELTSISFSHDGKYLATTENNKIFIRDLQLKRYSECFKKNSKCLDDIDKAYFTPWKTLGKYSIVAKRKRNEGILSVVLKNKPRKTGNYYSIDQLDKYKQRNIETFDFHPNQQQYMITGEKNGEHNILFWDLRNLANKEQNIINLGKKDDLKSDGIFINRLTDYTTKIISVDQKGKFKIQEFESGNDQTIKLSERFPDFPTNIIALTILQDLASPISDKLAIITQEPNQGKSLVLCNLSTDRCEHDNKYDLSALREIKVIRSNRNINRIVVTDNNNQAYFINLENNLSQLLTKIKDVDISPDGLHVVSIESNDRSILYNWKEEKIDISIDLENGVNRVRFSNPQGQYIGISRNKKLKIKTKSSAADDYTEHEGLSADLSNVDNFAFSQDEKYIAVVKGNDENIIQIKNLLNDDIDIPIIEVDSSIKQLVFSPELSINIYNRETTLNLIATAELDGKVSLWDLKGRLLAEFDSIKGEIVKLQFSPKQKLDNGQVERIKYLIAIVEEKEEQGSIYRQVWNLDRELNLEKLINRECEWYDSNLSKEQGLKDLGSKCSQISATNKANSFELQNKNDRSLVVQPSQ